MENNDKTQILSGVQPTKASGNIRIEEVRQPQRQAKKYHRPPKSKPGWQHKLKRMLVLIVFLLACGGGFYAMHSWNTLEQRDYNAKVHNVQELEAKSAQLAKQEAELARAKSELEVQEQQIAAERQQLHQEKPFFKMLVDKFTGKEAEEQAKDRQLDDQLNKLKASVSKVNQQLQQVQDVKNNVDKLRDKAKIELNHYEEDLDSLIYKLKLLLSNLKSQ